MGSPLALPWATIFFGIHELLVLAQFVDMLQLYHLFINDLVGIWLADPNPAEDNQKWTAFKPLLQCHYNLEWLFE